MSGARKELSYSPQVYLPKDWGFAAAAKQPSFFLYQAISYILFPWTSSQLVWNATLNYSTVCAYYTSRLLSSCSGEKLCTTDWEDRVKSEKSYSTNIQIFLQNNWWIMVIRQPVNISVEIDVFKQNVHLYIWKQNILSFHFKMTLWQWIHLKLNWVHNKPIFSPSLIAFCTQR